MSQSDDHLEPEEVIFWLLPVIRRYYAAVGNVLVADPTPIRAAMLCLPSFEPEWLISINQKTDQRGNRLDGQFLVCLTEAKETIWLDQKAAHEIPTHVVEQEIDAHLVEQLVGVWKTMLLATRSKPPMGRFDGVSYRFLIGDEARELTGKTWSPDENTNESRLVGTGEALRQLALAEDSQRHQVEKEILRRILELRSYLDHAV